jgi:hypothetical protein
MDKNEIYPLIILIKETIKTRARLVRRLIWVEELLCLNYNIYNKYYILKRNNLKLILRDYFSIEYIKIYIYKKTIV